MATPNSTTIEPAYVKATPASNELRGMAPMSPIAVVALHSISAVWLYFRLFQFPSTPFLLGGDQVCFWFLGQRMLHNERLYLDFFHFTPPGATVLYATAFWLFGERAWVPNFVVLLFGVLLSILVLHIARYAMNARAAMLTTVLTVFLYGYAANGTHHWLSNIVVLAGVAVLLPNLEYPRICAAGALFALTAFITQTRGAAALVAVVIFLLLQNCRAGQPLQRTLLRIGTLLGIFGAAFLLLNAYFLMQAGPRLMWYCQVTYVVRYSLSAFAWNLSTGATSWHDLPGAAVFLLLFALVPAVYAILLLRYLRSSGKAITSPVLLLGCVGLFQFLEIALAPTRTRLFPVLVPAVIVLMALYWRHFSGRRSFVLATLVVLVLAIRLTWMTQTSHAAIAELPTGRTAIGADKYQEMLWLKQHTVAGQWVYAPEPDLYFPLQLRSPAYAHEITPYKVTRPEWIAQILDVLEKRQIRYVIWAEYFNAPAPKAEDDSLGPLRVYLHDHYRLVQTFDDGQEVLERMLHPETEVRHLR